MIYQLTIAKEDNLSLGVNDNLYIITGGLTGISSFSPTEIVGQETPVKINVDAKEDTLFTPWIKQSMQVNLLETSEGLFDPIYSGNDNDTYGVLIENGELELISGDLHITPNGILRFIGTLTLESLVRDYKELTAISFTFFDRIGIVENDGIPFKPELRVMTVPNIFAELLNPIICSHILFMEWPYDGRIPEDMMIDIGSFYGDDSATVLETMLKDFGLQMIVDFAANATAHLKDAGCIVLRHVNDSYKLNFVNRKYYIYATVGTYKTRYEYIYGNNTLIIKDRYEMGSDDYPIINNDLKQELDRVASSVHAVNNPTLNDNMIIGGEFDAKYLMYDPTSGQQVYTPMNTISGADLYNDLCQILLGNTQYLNHAPTAIIEDAAGYLAYKISGTTYKATITPMFQVTTEMFVGGSFSIDWELIHRWVGTTYSYNNYLTFIKHDVTGYYYLYYNSGALTMTWVAFSSQADLLLGQKLSGSAYERNTSHRPSAYTVSPIADTYDTTFMAVIISEDATPADPYEYLHITSFKINQITGNQNYPVKIELDTTLSGNNRKVIELAPTILNAPSIAGSEYKYDNLIIDELDGTRPYTTLYNGVEQTMLAHLSDQYGYQYNSNRWNLDGTIKAYFNPMNITQQFTLEDNIYILVSGEYDAKRRELKGKFYRVLGSEPHIPAILLRDDYTAFRWDDGTYININ